MYRTRKIRKNGGTNKKNPANAKSSKRIQQKKQQKIHRSKKARGPHYSSTDFDEFGPWGQHAISVNLETKYKIVRPSPRTDEVTSG